MTRSQPTPTRPATCRASLRVARIATTLAVAIVLTATLGGLTGCGTDETDTQPPLAEDFHGDTGEVTTEIDPHLVDETIPDDADISEATPGGGDVATSDRTLNDPKLEKVLTFLNRVEQGVKLADSLKHAVEQAVESGDGLPQSLSTRASLPGVNSMTFVNGAIVIDYADDGEIEGGTLELRPVVDGNDVNWQCEGGTLSAQYRPDECA